jgi:hypothetical protein
MLPASRPDHAVRGADSPRQPPALRRPNLRYPPTTAALLLVNRRLSVPVGGCRRPSGSKSNFLLTRSSRASVHLRSGTLTYVHLIFRPSSLHRNDLKRSQAATKLCAAVSSCLFAAIESLPFVLFAAPIRLPAAAPSSSLAVRSLNHQLSTLNSLPGHAPRRKRAQVPQKTCSQRPGIKGFSCE